MLAGHLESKSSIKRVLAITTVLSLAYSVTQVRGSGGQEVLGLWGGAPPARARLTSLRLCSLTGPSETT